MSNCACARARVGKTRLERIPFIDVGTRRTRKRKGRRTWNGKREEEERRA